MNTDKAGRLLRKIQALYDNLSDQGTMSSLERDLLLSYLRDLYEEFSAGPVTAKAYKEEVRTSPPPPPVYTPPAPPKVEERHEHYIPPPPAPPKVEERHEHYTPPSPPQPPPVVEKPAPTEPATHYSREPQPSTPPVLEPVRVPPPAAEPLQTNDNGTDEDHAAIAALFEFKQTGELAEKLQLQPLERIESGMGINERILMINELFRGDGDLFRKTLSDLNALSSFDEAKTFLIRGVASRLQWRDEARKPQALVFIQLVRRRFLN